MTAARARTRLSAAERREQLMAAAVEVVAESGFRAATADAVAGRAGVSKGLLWHYFDDLDDLFQHTARRTVMEIARGIGADLDLDASTPEIVRAAVHAAARVPQTFRSEQRALQQIVPNLRTADGSPRMTLDDYDELHTEQEALFRRGQERGEIDAGIDARVLAIGYQGAVDAMIAHLQLHPDVDADDFADQVAELLLAGCAVRQSPE